MKNLIIFFFSTIFFSCSPSYYLPNTQVVPILKSKGDNFVSISRGSTESAIGYELGYARAITKNIGVLGIMSSYSGSYTGKQSNFPFSHTPYGYGSGFMGEMGIGKYKTFDKFVFENYVLAGYADFIYNTNMEDDYYIVQSISANYFRSSWQSSIAYSRKHFEMAFSGRSSRLDYFNIQHVGRWGMDERNYLLKNKIHYLFEPGITLRFGLKNIKLSAQLIRSYNFKKYDFKQDFARFGLGLDVKF